ncbi:O-methyltransferase [Aquibacillus sp. 3ASR75-11]|uniref:tRNA 5-hydroxyuridine methyltransferase n=1 Tax=Terrihalobacillus insolitus TaxID=2950438 RepID=A0A9X3WVB3_9BACI|nr:O-methyltransferase [Terrihalobacillus insolitus]MDC3413298.1 O-methyltransferase [Terrihalobacillus insolitus]MDC3424881.1 O-methyltransferase [Terrihalobacillus insolitus]
MENKLYQYLDQMVGLKKDWMKQIESQAKNEQIPIMEPLGLDFLKQIIRLKQPKKILEIGTAIGYSALQMLDASPTSTIVTIERDVKRYKQAMHNITSLDKQKHIEILLGDAFAMEQEAEKRGPYDLLFIDAAKGQYQRFFETFHAFVRSNGVIISDNVLFRGLVVKEESSNKRLQQIAAKIRDYNEWLVNHSGYSTTIIPVGDGVAVSVKK